jgi:hypothetical protein
VEDLNIQIGVITTRKKADNRSQPINIIDEGSLAALLKLHKT